MNILQRVVLVVGAIFFLIVLLTAPKISIVKGTYVVPPSEKKEIAKITDLNTAIVRGVAILGTTLLIFLALREKRGTPSQSVSNPELPFNHKDGKEGLRQFCRKRIILKIINFFKEFF